LWRKRQINATSRYAVVVCVVHSTVKAPLSERPTLNYIELAIQKYGEPNPHLTTSEAALAKEIFTGEDFLNDQFNLGVGNHSLSAISALQQSAEAFIVYAANVYFLATLSIEIPNQNSSHSEVLVGPLDTS